MSKVVIFGSGGWAQYLHYLLTLDSEHEVVGFTVDPEYVREPTLLGLPVVGFDRVDQVFPPAEHRMLVGVSYQRLNQLRREKYQQAKARGYQFISYVSSRAMAVPDLVLGENCLVLEGAIIQPFVTIGDDVTVCAAAVVGHHTVIKDHAFVAPGAVLLGLVTVGENCLVGARATLHQGIELGQDCMVGMGVTLAQGAPAGSVYVSHTAELLPQTSLELVPFLAW